MIRKFFYSVIKFQPIGLFQGNKIKQSQIIYHSKTNADLFKFYQEFGQQLNLINIVSYIRKYTDNMISNNELENEVQIKHTFSTLKQLKEMIETEKYKTFGDKETDHKRSFIMLLSLSVELTQRTRSESNQLEFLNYAKLAIQKLKEQDRLLKCNIEELSVFLRCITQINELNPSENEEIEYWGLINNHTHSLTPHVASKLLHSLSKFKTFNEKQIENLLGQLNSLENTNINQKDANSLFFSFKHIYEKSKLFHETIQILFVNLQNHMLMQHYRLNSKQIGMIYNVLATVPITVKSEFIDYLQTQLIATQMTMLCLAHLFQFYQTKPNMEISINLENKIIAFLQQTQIQNIYESEQFIMFFNSLGSYCTTNYIEAVIQIMKTIPLNDFVLGKIFSGLLKIPLTVDHYTDLCQISVTLLQKYDNIINIHSLNSIYRGQCILNARFSQIIQQVVDFQINQYSQQIFIEDYLKLIESKAYFQSFEFLQVLYDFLNIYTFTGTIGQKNKIIISEKLKILKVTIQEIKNDRLQQNVGSYLEQLDQFID